MIQCKVSRRLAVVTTEDGLERLEFAVLEREDGSTLVAADRLGAAVGSSVLVCQGPGAQAVLGAREPLDAAVIALLKTSAPE